jgi:deazaflavin-dependent oxidoreductase (nitroreductase family)
MNVRNTLADVGLKSVNMLHRGILKVSGGRWLSKPLGMNTVELHVTGRKSGLRRSVLLTAPLHDDTRTVLIASKGGDDRQPEWYLNLSANPDVELTIKGVTKPYYARTATPEEKAELWPQVIAVYKGYGNYQKRTTRDIPVVICTPR